MFLFTTSYFYAVLLELCYVHVCTPTSSQVVIGIFSFFIN